MKAIEEMEKIGFKNSNFDLEASFDEALENEEFKKFIEALKVPRKHLIKYTSILEKSAKEYNNCLKCKSILSCKNQVCGHCYVPRMVDNKPIFEYKPCNFYKKQVEELKYRDNIYFNHISEDIKNANIDDIYMNDKKRLDVIEYLFKFIKDYPKKGNMKGLYLNGSFGCGKTYLVSAAFNALAKEGCKSAIIFWPEFLLELKSSFETDFKEKYDYVKTVPLLLIDDIGAESVTEWTRDDILCPLLQYRMENHLKTFFTSNLTMEELEMHYAKGGGAATVKSKRIIERVKQLTEEKSVISKNLRK